MKKQTARRFIRTTPLASILMLALPLAAQDDVTWRGAWTADVGGTRYILYLVAHEGGMSGTWCHDCSNADHLAFVDDGTAGAAGLHFTLYSTSSAGADSVVPVDARIDGDTMHMALKPPGADAIALVLQRAPAWVEPPPRTPGTAPARARELPGPAQTLTPDTLAGLWLTGSGPGKQYFNFKRHEDGIRGLVCGPCDDPHTFAPLENVHIDGTRVTFDIVHEDNGFGFAQHGPFRNVTTAQIARNEMQMTTHASYEPDGPRVELTLLGPVRYMPQEQP